MNEYEPAYDNGGDEYDAELAQDYLLEQQELADYEQADEYFGPVSDEYFGPVCDDDYAPYDGYDDVMDDFWGDDGY